MATGNWLSLFRVNQRAVPFALLIAFAVSLGVHALALFGADAGLSTSLEPPRIFAELLPPPEPLRPAPQAAKPAQKTTARPKPSRPKAAAVASAAPVLSTPEPSNHSNNSMPSMPAVEPVAAPVIEAAPAESRLPAHGMIRYRVDRGDQGFEVGHSTHDWEIVDGAYRITSVTETSGLAALFKPVLIELESRGRVTADGLQPESFMIRRGGRDTKEKARFDWAQMQVQIGKAASQPLSSGAQDLLSFHYQLGFLPNPSGVNTLPIATGKKYVAYRFEALGDEEIEIPAGAFRTLHLRAPGDTTTELWLAYDYLLLPVKIRHLDRDGDSFVQVATEIRLSKD
jgi:hypothetical protein